MKQNSNVPAFLTKLWTLVEDAETNEFICWSQEGNSFLVLDEQGFAKDILPKFFKHNNMASFIRQLNMYGFRKVMHMDTGIVKQEKDGPVEFQHPYFKHGQDDLLENIKRKVSNTRPEDNKLRQEDLSKILATVQNVHGKQESIDSRLSALKRENDGLWREIADLRQKHNHQQQIIKKLIQFIVSLVQNNHILSTKRKRPPLLMTNNGKKPKYIHPIFDENSPVNGLSEVKSSDLTSDDVIICDVTDSDAEILEGTSRLLDQGDVEIVEVDMDNYTALQPEMETMETAGRFTEETVETDPGPSTEPEENVRGACSDSPAPTSSALQLNKPSGLSMEDPMKLMDSILNENGAISQNINLLGKVELMDYLDSIDCSLEDFQAMLYGKQFSIDPDALEFLNSDCPVNLYDSDACPANESMESKENSGSKTESHNTDKQLIQYTSCPLLTFLDGYSSLAPSTDLELGASSSSSSAGGALPSPRSSAPDVGSEPPRALLSTDEPSPRPRSSSLIRLEPLTEAEASEASLFYLCELTGPDDGGPLGDSASSLDLG
ncbi:heat shock factor protein 2 [Aplochiton taeniatus]